MTRMSPGTIFGMGAWHRYAVSWAGGLVTKPSDGVWLASLEAAGLQGLTYNNLFGLFFDGDNEIRGEIRPISTQVTGADFYQVCVDAGATGVVLEGEPSPSHGLLSDLSGAVSGVVPRDAGVSPGSGPWPFVIGGAIVLVTAGVVFYYAKVQG